MSVVSNSSPLIALTRIQRLDLVPTISAVRTHSACCSREIAPSFPRSSTLVGGAGTCEGASVLTPRGRLGDGEWEAIALAVELGAAALIDDPPAAPLPAF